jgi:hypothetical protein
MHSNILIVDPENFQHYASLSVLDENDCSRMRVLTAHCAMLCGHS